MKLIIGACVFSALVCAQAYAAPVPVDVYVEENVRTLERLRALPFDTLIPGHGEPQHGRAYLDRLTNLVRDIHNQVAPLATQGLSVEEVTARIDTEQHARAFAGDDAWLRLWFRDYAATPLIESAFREARGESAPD